LNREVKEIYLSARGDKSEALLKFISRGLFLIKRAGNTLYVAMRVP
jgi:hypothetical protein